MVALQAGNVGVQRGTAKGRIGQVAVPGIPGHVALEKQDVVPAAHQFTHQAAVGGGVAVAPRRSDREPEDDDLER